LAGKTPVPSVGKIKAMEETLGTERTVGGGGERRIRGKEARKAAELRI